MERKMADMKNNSKDRAMVIIPPPLIFLACLGVGVFLEYLFPFHFIHGAWTFRIIIACSIFAASGLIAMSAFKTLSNNKTPFDPAKSTVKIAREGSYRFSRNPMYLALLLVLCGIAALICSIWLISAIPILFILFGYLAVRPEEKYLETKFGKDYLDYKTSVRRWI
jgi:protein-S-isoprenylcysteine O-methyltransferase Ste14